MAFKMKGWRKEFRQENREHNKAERKADGGEGQGIKNFFKGRKAVKAAAKAEHFKGTDRYPELQAKADVADANTANPPPKPKRKDKVIAQGSTREDRRKENKQERKEKRAKKK